MAKNDMRAYYVFALKAMSEITAIILLPALAALALRSVYVGSPGADSMFVLSLLAAFILSMTVAVRKIQSYGREYRKLTDASQPPSAGSGSSS